MKNRPILRVSLIVVGLIVLIYLFLIILPKQQHLEGDNPFMSGEGNPPHIIAHAGGIYEFPENTLEAFYNTYSVDPNAIFEMDVVMTEDNVIILGHDVTLDQTTTLQEVYAHEITYDYLLENEIDFGYKNPIPNNTFNEEGVFERYRNEDGEIVSPLDVEYPEGVEPRHEEKFLVTTLEDVITAFPDTYMVVELKQYEDLGLEALDEIIRLMEELDDEYNTFERISLASFDRGIYDAYVELTEEYPDLMFSPQEDSIRKFYVMHRLFVTGLFRDPVTSFQVPMGQGAIDLTTERFVKNVQAHNIAVHYWTINEEEDMRTLIELGVDGIITDRPSFMRSLIEEYYPDHYQD